MTTTTDAKVYRTSRGNVPQGHNRWLRAAINAAIRPNSQAAQLYRDRVFLAQQAVARLQSTGFRHQNYRGETEFYTCSTYCAAMTAQLVVSGYTQVSKYLSGVTQFNQWGYSHPTAFRLMREDLKRPVKCRCCGTTIKPK